MRLGGGVMVLLWLWFLSRWWRLLFLSIQLGRAEAL
jgi:hypothetical protein